MTPLTLMSTLARVLPADVAVVEEAVTTTGTYFERLGALHNTTRLFQPSRLGAGLGLGCAVGVRLAWPERPVLALLGDGAALYGIQGLWTAASIEFPVTYVICNNAQYRILKTGSVSLGLPKRLSRPVRRHGPDRAGGRFRRTGPIAGRVGPRVTEPDELATCASPGRWPATARNYSTCRSCAICRESSLTENAACEVRELRGWLTPPAART